MHDAGPVRTREGEDDLAGVLTSHVLTLSCASALCDLLHSGDVELELDLLADEHAALVEREVPREVPVATVDGRAALEAGAEVAPRVVGGAGELELHGDGVGLVVDGEVADEGVDVVLDLRDLGAGEGDRRELLDVEEVRGAQ